ncbi:MAG: hypothetical protein KGH58_01680 [Candidatus Micrarchaeota archaeon]|nr:hypothetical protein [Candidatus Micrarchaeota archaeon]
MAKTKPILKLGIIIAVIVIILGIVVALALTGTSAPQQPSPQQNSSVSGQAQNLSALGQYLNVSQPPELGVLSNESVPQSP